MNLETDNTEKILNLIRAYIDSDDPVDMIKHLFEAGAQYGHPTRAWNPAMKQFIHCVENKSHILDVRHTLRHAIIALEFLYSKVKQGAKVVFVCTDQQMAEMTAVEANRCGQHYITRRWRGGLLTNWSTTKKSIDQMHSNEKLLEEHGVAMKKKVRFSIQRSIDKARQSLGGIETMSELPNIVIISSLIKECVAVDEVRRLQVLGVPIYSIGFADTNSNPQKVDYPIPSNDDSIRVIEFMFKLMANVVIEGLIDGGNEVDSTVGASMDAALHTEGIATA